MKKKLLVALVVFSFGACACGTQSVSTEQYMESTVNSTASTESVQATETEEPEPEPQTINLIMVGDMLMHTRVLDSGLQEDGSYNFDHLYDYVEDRVSSADLAIANDETILGGKELGISSYPCFNSPFELGDAEVAAGFDLFLGATNHALDRGKDGILNCVSFWETNYPDKSIIGIYDSEEEANEIYVFEKNGISVAVLNYTYGTNGFATPTGMDYCVNYLNEAKVRDDIARANEMADFVVVCPHWGNEYQLTASQEQKNWCQIFLECGVDLVIGTHPHVIEPIEWYEDAEGNRMLVYYSLGNFVNGTESTGAGIANRMLGGMADVTIGKDENGVVSIWDYSIHGLVCHEGPGTEYTVYYLEDYSEEMAAKNWIVSSDYNFSWQYCINLANQVWESEYNFNGGN